MMAAERVDLVAVHDVVHLPGMADGFRKGETFSVSPATAQALIACGAAEPLIASAEDHPAA
jgi:hypothetical protein